jgi:hypothetical protein
MEFTDEIKKEADRMIDFLMPLTLEGQIDVYKYIVNSAFFILSHESRERPGKAMYADANMLYQMTILKCHSILNLSRGIIGYINPLDGISFKHIYDPFSIYNIVRSQYEAFCNFNNIYIVSKIDEAEKEFKYYLWEISGLKYRQRFDAEMEENKTKKEVEKKLIEELKNKIFDNTCFEELNEASKARIKEEVEKNGKEWKIEIVNKDARWLAWHEMAKNAGLNSRMQMQIYSHLSLSTHPSNVSVFQFESLYSSGEHVKATVMAMKISSFIISFLISDFCHYSTTAAKTFMLLPHLNQHIINTYNNMLRSEKYKIPDAV